MDKAIYEESTCEAASEMTSEARLSEARLSEARLSEERANEERLSEAYEARLSEIRFIPFRASHAYSMDWKDKEEFLGLVAGSPQYFYSLEAANGALTAIKHDLILGILVITPYNPRHCNVLIYMSTSYIGEFGKDIYALTKKVIEDLCITYERVSAEVRTDNEKLAKLMKYLGFDQEGIMRKYGYKGEDYSLYAIVQGA